MAPNLELRMWPRGACGVISLVHVNGTFVRPPSAHFSRPHAGLHRVDSSTSTCQFWFFSDRPHALTRTELPLEQSAHPFRLVGGTWRTLAESVQSSSSWPFASTCSLVLQFAPDFFHPTSSPASGTFHSFTFVISLCSCLDSRFCAAGSDQLLKHQNLMHAPKSRLRRAI